MEAYWSNEIILINIDDVEDEYTKNVIWFKYKS